VGGALHPQHEGPPVARLVRLRAPQLPGGKRLLRLRARRRRRVPRPHLPGRRAGRAGGQAPEQRMKAVARDAVCIGTSSNAYLKRLFEVPIIFPVGLIWKRRCGAARASNPYHFTHVITGSLRVDNADAYRPARGSRRRS
jgi:hypothetical protein